jgi:pyruvate/2-oxoglutarate/acetoin dehydrogenase E1 component
MGRELTYTEALREALDEELTRDPATFLMGEDVVTGTFGVSSGLINIHGPERIRNTPISEAAIVGAGLGAALAGARPIVELQFASLVYLAMDQLANQVGKVRYMSGNQVHAPITIRAAVAMGVGAGAQHSDTPHALLAHTPGLKIALPSGPRDAKGLLKSAIRDDDPVVVFEHAALMGTREEVPDDEELIPLGVARQLREGSDVTVVALGSAVPPALAAAAALASDGISVEVLDPRTIVPMDWDALLESVARTGRAVVVDDANPTCSFAAEVAAVLAEYAFGDLRAPVRRVTREHTPTPFSPPLEQRILIDEAKVAAAIRSTVEVTA